MKIFSIDYIGNDNILDILLQEIKINFICFFLLF